MAPALETPFRDKTGGAIHAIGTIAAQPMNMNIPVRRKSNLRVSRK
jgi:hypothetical protein